MKSRILLALLILFTFSFLACQKREPASPVAASGPVGIQAPEEPVLHLAWMAASQLQVDLQQLRQPLVLKMLPLENTAGIPPGAAEYFQAALETRLQTFGLRMPGDAPIQLQGSLYWLRNQLVYGMKLRKDDQVLMTDSASIPHDDRLD
ncbi:MAG TPA: hypothetical protein VLR94_01730, partial [Acidobacteriota bacterium]|nr:hypothetical protein [Acidobacteriota bacterium]